MGGNLHYCQLDLGVNSDVAIDDQNPNQGHTASMQNLAMAGLRMAVLLHHLIYTSDHYTILRPVDRLL